MAILPRVPTGNNKQYTLDAQAAAGATSVTLNQSVAGVVRAPGYFVVDRIDSSNGLTPTKREYKYFTGVSGAQLTGVTSVDGTDQVHAVGAIVEFTPDVKQEQDWYDWAITEHSIIGQHASLPSLTIVKTLDLYAASTASLQLVNVMGRLNASGASLTGFPIHPTWVISGLVSLVTTAVGKPVDMPQAGTIESASAILRAPVSGASLVLDINKNFTSIFTDQNTRLSILSGGTFASTASVGTKIFAAGDVFSVDIDNGGGLAADLTIKFRAR